MYFRLIWLLLQNISTKVVVSQFQLHQRDKGPDCSEWNAILHGLPSVFIVRHNDSRRIMNGWNNE